MTGRVAGEEVFEELATELGGARASGAVGSALHAYLLLSALVIVVWRAIDLIKGSGPAA